MTIETEIGTYTAEKLPLIEGWPLASAIAFDDERQRMGATAVRFLNEYVLKSEFIRQDRDGQLRNFGQTVVAAASTDTLWNIRRSDDGHYWVALADAMRREIDEPAVTDVQESGGQTDLSVRRLITAYTQSGPLTVPFTYRFIIRDGWQAHLSGGPSGRTEVLRPLGELQAQIAARKAAIARVEGEVAVDHGMTALAGA